MKKMIERFIIKTEDGSIVNSIEDMTNEPIRVFDREKGNTISKINTFDKEWNFAIAVAIVDACDEYTPTEPSVDVDTDGGN